MFRDRNTSTMLMRSKKSVSFLMQMLSRIFVLSDSESVFKRTITLFVIVSTGTFCIIKSFGNKDQFIIRFFFVTSISDQRNMGSIEAEFNCSLFNVSQLYYVVRPPNVRVQT